MEVVWVTNTIQWIFEFTFAFLILMTLNAAELFQKIYQYMNI